MPNFKYFHIYSLYEFCFYILLFFILIPDPYLATFYVKIIFSAMFVSWQLNSVCLASSFLSMKDTSEKWGDSNARTTTCRGVTCSQF
jgi:hypothetical protein